jgi:NitT/TauT family transport system permease protein
VLLAPLGNGRLLLALEPRRRERQRSDGRPRTLGRAGLAGLVWLGVAAALAWTAHYVLTSLSVGDMVGRAGLITMLRVIVLIALASLVWVPLGVAIGLRPRLAERVQPSPSSLPPSRQRAVSLCGDRHRPLESAARYLAVAADDPGHAVVHPVQRDRGASAIPTDLREAAGMFGVRGWQWWRQVALPGIFPYYITGALTAGSWNASIVAEVVTWAAIITWRARPWRLYRDATTAGNYPQVALGIGVMSLFVLGFNRLVWRPLYAFGERRLRCLIALFPHGYTVSP